MKKLFMVHCDIALYIISPFLDNRYCRLLTFKPFFSPDEGYLCHPNWERHHSKNLLPMYSGYMRLSLAAAANGLPRNMALNRQTFKAFETIPAATRIPEPVFQF